MATYDEIARVAFELYKSRGDRGGDPLQDWLEAEKILAEKESTSKKSTRKAAAPKKEPAKTKSKSAAETPTVESKPKGRKKA